jgi:hypothetical protein
MTRQRGQTNLSQGVAFYAAWTDPSVPGCPKALPFTPRGQIRLSPVYPTSGVTKWINEF